MQLLSRKLSAIAFHRVAPVPKKLAGVGIDRRHTIKFQIRQKLLRPADRLFFWIAQHKTSL